jgi:hypothetical protein
MNNCVASDYLIELQDGPGKPNLHRTMSLRFLQLLPLDKGSCSVSRYLYSSTLVRFIPHLNEPPFKLIQQNPSLTLHTTHHLCRFQSLQTVDPGQASAHSEPLSIRFCNHRGGLKYPQTTLERV